MIYPDSDFETQVANALEHLWESACLGKQPLTELRIVERRVPCHSWVSHVDRGRALSQVLQLAIEQLKPAAEQRISSSEARYYLILHMAYVEGSENKVIARSLGITKRTFYRNRVKAIRVIAQILRDWEEWEEGAPKEAPVKPRS